jgi:hypothetical protein
MHSLSRQAETRPHLYRRMFPDPTDGYNLINEKRITKQSLRNPFQFLARIQDLLGAFPGRKQNCLATFF